jgi:hypothetical protein
MIRGSARKAFSVLASFYLFVFLLWGVQAPFFLPLFYKVIKGEMILWMRMGNLTFGTSVFG